MQTRRFHLLLLLAPFLIPEHQLRAQVKNEPPGVNLITGDTLTLSSDSSGLQTKEQKRPFRFITRVPGNIASLVQTPFLKRNHRNMAVLAGGTAVLILLDQPIINAAESFFNFIGIEQQEDFKPLIQVGNIDLLSRPRNINSFFYQLGDTGPTMLMAGGYYLYGKLSRNRRAVRTSGELVESYLTSQLAVQVLKRITGRQSPNRATKPGGVWHWFPSLKKYEKNTTNYIAYPSGHMATMMSAVTVIALNYPEKKWIKPVGYTLTALTALSQLNNKTHWASDYLLGLAIGYASANITHLRKRK